MVVVEAHGGRVDATNVFGRGCRHRRDSDRPRPHRRPGPDGDGDPNRETAVFAGRTTAVLGPQPSSEAVDVARATAAEHGVRLVEVAATNDWRHDAEATLPPYSLNSTRRRDPVFGHSPVGTSRRTSPRSGHRADFDGAHNPMKLTALVGPFAPGGPRLGIVSVGEEGPRRLCCCDCPSAGCCDRGAVRPVARFVRAAESSDLGDGRRVPCRWCCRRDRRNGRRRSRRDCDGSRRGVNGGGYGLVPPPERRPTSVASPSDHGAGNVTPDRVSRRVRRAPRPATVPSPRSG